MEEKSVYVIVALGNPGKKYAMTRHNLGFITLQAFAETQGWKFKEEGRFQALVAKGTLPGKKGEEKNQEGKSSEEKIVFLLMPTTYMNLSGVAVKAFLDYYRLAPEHLLVVNDDVELPFGSMRLRPKGSAGGHNGLKSLEASLNTVHYARLRLGIGRSKKEESLAGYVLDNFSQEEMGDLPPFIKKGIEALNYILENGIAEAMQKVNAKIKVKEENPSNGLGEKKHESN
jgi:PTH1 family peptidyl-tRNA hydrolase